MEKLYEQRGADRGRDVAVAMSRMSASVVVGALALPVVLTSCPQFLGDWTLSAASADDGGDATMQDAGTGSDGRTEGGRGEGSTIDAAVGAPDTLGDRIDAIEAAPICSVDAAACMVLSIVGECPDAAPVFTSCPMEEPCVPVGCVARQGTNADFCCQ